MGLFFISFLIIYLLLHYYIFSRFVTVFRFEAGSYFIVLCIFLILACWGILAEYFSNKTLTNGILRTFAGCGYIWFGVLSITFFFFFITDIIHIFVRNNQFIYYSTLISCLLAVICSAYSVFNVMFREPVIKNIYLKVSNLTVEKLKIVQLSDIHIDSYTSYEEIKKIVKRTNALNPDIVILAGDILESRIGDEYRKYDLDKIKAKYGIFAVSGNHEYYMGIEEFYSFCGKIKANVIHNTNIIAGGIYIAGIPDTKSSKRFNSQPADIKKALKNIDFTKPVVFLSHQPDSFSEVSKYPVSLQLSGHTHAGQIPPFDLIEYVFFKYYYGLYKENNSYLYVSSGTRWWGPPMRLFSKSEIVCINLYREKA